MILVKPFMSLQDFGTKLNGMVDALCSAWQVSPHWMEVAIIFKLKFYKLHKSTYLISLLIQFFEMYISFSYGIMFASLYFPSPFHCHLYYHLLYFRWRGQELDRFTIVILCAYWSFLTLHLITLSCSTWLCSNLPNPWLRDSWSYFWRIFYLLSKTFHKAPVMLISHFWKYWTKCDSANWHLWCMHGGRQWNQLPWS
jgi:hypothetical protein